MKFIVYYCNNGPSKNISNTALVRQLLSIQNCVIKRMSTVHSVGVYATSIIENFCLSSLHFGLLRFAAIFLASSSAFLASMSAKIIFFVATIFMRGDLRLRFCWNEQYVMLIVISFRENLPHNIDEFAPKYSRN